MDKRYTYTRGVSYASSYTPFHNSTSSDMATMTFSGAAVGGGIEMRQMDDRPKKTDDSLPMKDEEVKGTSCRRICSCITIVPMIFGVIALVVLGIVYLPEPTNPPPPAVPEPMPFCAGPISPSASASAHSDCSSIAASVAFDVSKVRLSYPGNQTIINASLSLSEPINITMAGLWTISWSEKTKKLTVSPITGALTCNMEGTYLFEYLNSNNGLVYYQTFSLSYLGNLADVRVSAQPYLADDGISKSVYLACTMKTGCHHGIIVPELKKGDDVLFIRDASCSYSFNISEGGEVTCTTDIDADVWTSKDEVICALKPDDGVHKLVQVGRMATSIADLTNFCSLVTLTIGEPGYINCKKRIHGDVDIILERKSHYFGDWTQLLTISGEGGGKALNDRLTFTASRIADIIEINITLSEVHCGDKGHLALNYSDGSRTDIEIEVTSAIPPSCPASVTRALHPDANFRITCSWCPGHDVDEVLVNHTKTINGVGTMLPSFPITFFLDVKTTHKGQNLTIQFTQEYGVMMVAINRLKGVGCNYGDDYSITLRSQQGSSTKSVHVNITIPESLYTYSMTDTPVIAGRDLDIEFKGFMGCSVSDVIARRDGIPLIASDVTVEDEDIRDARAFKIVWSYTPVTLALVNTRINASVSFLPLGETTPRSYTVSKRFIVLEDSMCLNSPSCNLPHPTDFSLFVACNSAGVIEAVNSCPQGLSLIFPDPANCLGQCG